MRTECRLNTRRKQYVLVSYDIMNGKRRAIYDIQRISGARVGAVATAASTFHVPPIAAADYQTQPNRGNIRTYHTKQRTNDKHKPQRMTDRRAVTKMETSSFTESADHSMPICLPAIIV